MAAGKQPPVRGLLLQRLLAICLTLSLLLLARLAAPGLFTTTEQVAGDWLWRTMARVSEERRVVIVDIDEASLSRIGPWPARDKMAKLLENLHAAGAGTVLLDVVFADPRPGDVTLAAAMRAGPTVSAQLFAPDDSAFVSSGALAGAIPGLTCPPEFMQARGFIGAAPGLAGDVVGHISPRIDRDGTIRRLPTLACLDGRAYPALSLAAFMRSTASPLALDLVPTQGVSALFQPHWWLRHKDLSLQLPLDAEGNSLVGYGLTRASFISLPAADVIEGRFPADWIRGAWVIVGATAFGLGDAVSTPLGGRVGGVEVHAQQIAAALDGRVPFRPRGAALFQVLVVAAGIALLLWLAQRGQGNRGQTWALPTYGFVLGLAVFALHALMLGRWSLWPGFVEGGVALAVAGLTLGTLEHARARSEWNRLFRHFSSYLPAPVAASLAQMPLSSQIDAERCEVTALVADIRNFSAYVEGRPPEESGALLHAFFTGCAKLVKAHGGEIDQFTGDAVIALWNAGTPCANAPAKALACAEAMHAWFEDRFPGPPPPGLEPLGLGIGLETGPALAGSFGPSERRVYTALGEAVTVARRLEALTGDLARPILLGAGAFEQINDARLEYLGEFLLEGLRRPHRVWSPPIIERSSLPEPDDGAGPGNAIPFNIANGKRRMSA